MNSCSLSIIFKKIYNLLLYGFSAEFTKLLKMSRISFDRNVVGLDGILRERAVWEIALQISKS